MRFAATRKGRSLCPPRARSLDTDNSWVRAHEQSNTWWWEVDQADDVCLVVRKGKNTNHDAVLLDDVQVLARDCTRSMVRESDAPKGCPNLVLMVVKAMSACAVCPQAFTERTVKRVTYPCCASQWPLQCFGSHWLLSHMESLAPYPLSLRARASFSSLPFFASLRCVPPLKFQEQSSTADGPMHASIAPLSSLLDRGEKTAFENKVMATFLGKQYDRYEKRFGNLRRMHESGEKTNKHTLANTCIR